MALYFNLSYFCRQQAVKKKEMKRKKEKESQRKLNVEKSLENWV